MAEINKNFSSQNTKLEVFKNPTAQAILNAAISSANALLDVDAKKAALIAAYTAFFTAPVSKTIATTGLVTTDSKVQNDGYFSGTWSKSGQSGTFSSVSCTATAITANFFLASGTPASINLDAADLTFLTGNADKGTITTTSAVTGLLFSGVAGDVVGKVTGMGDTGKTYSIISAKLLSESGTMKAKGSSDEGDFTVDYLELPNDAGQKALENAFLDESANAGRVFRLTHLSSGTNDSDSAKVYFTGFVTELKKTRGSIDNFVSVKAKVAIQNGSVEDKPV